MAGLDASPCAIVLFMLGKWTIYIDFVVSGSKWKAAIPKLLRGWVALPRAVAALEGDGSLVAIPHYRIHAVSLK